MVGTCRIDGCLAPRASAGEKWRSLCSKHYRQRQRHGNVPDPPKSPGHLNAKGYVVVSGMRGHPLASVNGKVFQHRLVLLDKIGPGAHPCHWCGKSVTWDLRTPDLGALVTDHLNHDHADNAPANLVPSCIPCNAGRFE